MLQRKILTTLAGLAMFSAGFAHAQSDPTAVEFPMIGVGFNQTFQINVVSFSQCEVQLAILDSNGEKCRRFGRRKGESSIPFPPGRSGFSAAQAIARDGLAGVGDDSSLPGAGDCRGVR
jgi:hypothetical protein